MLLIFTGVSSAYALPQGAIKLSSDKRFKVGTVQCGKIGSKWLAGTLLNRNGYFISHTQYSKNFKNNAAKAAGKKKARLLKKAKEFSDKAKSQAATCTGGPKTKLSVVGAKTLVLLPTLGSSSTKSTESISSSTNKLFKITADGFIQEVSFTDDSGNVQASTESPVAVYDVDQDYVIVVFGIDDMNISDEYMVRKGDGKIFSLATVGFPSSYPTNTNFKNGKVVQADQNGDIYYKSRGTSFAGYGVFDLLKIDTSNPDQLTGARFSPSDESIYNFAVNSQGNVIYNSRAKTDLNSEFYRIKKTNGVFQNIPLNSTYWIGPDRNFYYQTQANPRATKKIAIDDVGNVVSSDYGDNSIGIPQNAGAYKFIFSDIELFADTSGWVVEANNLSSNPRRVSGLPIVNVRKGAQSNNYYYLSGNNSDANPILIKVDPLTDGYTQLYSAGKYDVYEMAASSDDVITFSALRLNDGKKVFVKIDSNGNETVINEELDVKAAALVQIN